MSGFLIIDLEGYSLTAAEKALLPHEHIGGILLFKRNYRSILQLKELIAEIRDTANKQILIMVDHEGGRIWRFYEQFTHIPAAKYFGALYEQDASFAKQQVRIAAMTIAYELLNCGIDLTLAPVLDLATINKVVIGDRAFHAEPNIVIELAKEFIAGLAELGMAAVGKHFPGHGGCNIDTHSSLAYDERAYEEIANTDLLPFKTLAAELPAIMPAHIIYPELDDVSAGFSKIWLQDILRKELNYSGAIISDCMAMKGAEFQGDFLARIQAALYAGCDMVILTQQKRELLAKLLSELTWQYTTMQLSRITKLAGDFTNPGLNQQLPKLADIINM